MFRRIPSVSSSYASFISFFLKQKNIFPPYIIWSLEVMKIVYSLTVYHSIY